MGVLRAWNGERWTRRGPVGRGGGGAAGRRARDGRGPGRRPARCRARARSRRSRIHRARAAPPRAAGCPAGWPGQPPGPRRGQPAMLPVVPRRTRRPRGRPAAARHAGSPARGPSPASTLRAIPNSHGAAPATLVREPVSREPRPGERLRGQLEGRRRVARPPEEEPVHAHDVAVVHDAERGRVTPRAAQELGIGHRVRSAVIGHPGTSGWCQRGLTRTSRARPPGVTSYP